MSKGVLTTYLLREGEHTLSYSEVRDRLNTLFSEKDVSCIMGEDCSYGLKEFKDIGDYVKAVTCDNRVLHFPLIAP